MNESMRNQNEESRAARRKYRAERRARIRQLFAPVRMVLTEDNFLRSEPVDKKSMTLKVSSEDSIEAEGPNHIEQNLAGESTEGEAKGDATYVYDSDDFILVPKPSVPRTALLVNQLCRDTKCCIATNHHQDDNNETCLPNDDAELRKVENECSICLCEYNVGSDIVWSSNPKCEHVFHTSCIEQWLMKQREGPLCPCCRRDFVIDPFDLGPGEIDDLEKGALSRNSNNGVSPATNVDEAVEIVLTDGSRVEMVEV